MFNFAAININELVAVITALGGLLFGFYKYNQTILKQGADDRNAEREERAAFIKALGQVADTNQKIADATNKAANEAEKRNGHLAEITVQSRDQVIEVLQNIKKQHVVQQVVETSTVQDETVEHETINSKDE